jgi:hypothetical protein
MPRIPEVPDETPDPEVRAIFEKQKEELGFVLNTSKIYAHRPSIMFGHAALSEGVSASGLIAPALQGLVCTRVASINGCPF